MIINSWVLGVHLNKYVQENVWANLNISFQSFPLTLQSERELYLFLKWVVVFLHYTFKYIFEKTANTKVVA